MDWECGPPSLVVMKGDFNTLGEVAGPAILLGAERYIMLEASAVEDGDVRNGELVWKLYKQNSVRVRIEDDISNQDANGKSNKGRSHTK